MKHLANLRTLALALCLVLCLSLLPVSAFAEDEIWVENPTGWTHGSHVVSNRVDGHLCNWGVRGETALFLSEDALDFYADNEWGVGKSWGYFAISDYAGGSGTANATASPLYTFLHDFLAGKQTHFTTYDETRELYRCTDCMANQADYISSFYSGRKLNGAWDSGAAWNLEHTWPNSKSTGQQEDDIMMLRPTSLNENSNRGNKAFGESAGYYDPNSESDGLFDLRGDCARICLYCYVRYPENTGSMWGQSGVMESLELLLEWMAQDPVDTWEMGRNDAVEDVTGVRNVFVDYPELAWALFGQEMPVIPTPMNGGDEWPPVSAVGTQFIAIPDDPAHGSVELNGLCAVTVPAEGYYASGFDVIRTGPYYIDPEAENPYADLLKWDRGRLLCMGQRELDVFVVIHFTPEGETDPCPYGHLLEEDSAELVTAPGCESYGQQRVHCSRCGKNVSIPIEPLGHDYDREHVEVIEVPTIDHCGIERIYCTRCHDYVDCMLEFSFADVPRYGSSYYCVAVYWALEHSPRITTGTDETHFTPDRVCSRAEVVTFLWRAAGCPDPDGTASFADVEPGSFYETAVSWAVEQGITLGTGSGCFSPSAPCTRAQVVTFLWRAAGSPPPSEDVGSFSDVVPGSYYETAVTWAVANGVTNGTGSGFSPEAPCTRAQVVTFLWRAPAI